MASGNRSGYGNWELGKGEINLDYCDVGLGLKKPWKQQRQQQQQHSSFSGGNGGGATFTSGQRQELERQTIIYKYMMASMPVPPELLIPIFKFPSSTTTTTTSEVGRKTGVETRYGSRGGDPEPWRCRRTDGKKWRCSRDVAPDQKYCERHSHKSRPCRSRKPVEPSPSSSSFPSSSATSLINSNTTSPVSSSCNPILFTPFPTPKPSSSSFGLPSPPPQFNPLPRFPDWFMKKEVSATAVSASACLCPQQNTPAAVEKRSCSSSHHQSCLLPRPFIDAWSLDNHVDPKDTSTNNHDSFINNGNNSDNTISTNKCPNSPLNSILPLTLSMSAGIELDESGDTTKDHPEICLSSHHQPINWWVSTPPGGPLAEALCLGMGGTGNGMMGSHAEDQLVSSHEHNNTSSSNNTTTLG